MIKEKIKQIEKQKNTQNLKYQSLLEEKIKNIQEIKRLQDKVIVLQEIVLKQKDELLSFKEKEIRGKKQWMMNQK